jgi:hypothetical protein
MNLLRNFKEGESMRKIAVWILAFGLMASPVLADGGSGDGTDNAKPANGSAADAAKQPAAPAKSADKAKAKPSLEEELDEMRAQLRSQADQITRQQEEIDAMKTQLATEAAAPNGVATASQPASAGAAPATVVANPAVLTAATPSSVASAANAPSSSGVSSAVSSPVTPTATASSYPAQQQDSEPAPLFFRIGSARFTPGGFMDLTDVFRTTGTGNGIGTSFGGIPFNNNFPTAGLTENRMSMQNSRIALRIDADVAGGKVAGYFEADFLGAIAQNANVTSNSNTFRSRLYFVDYRRGPWELLGGQEWSLLTPNRVGISPWPSDIFYGQEMDTNYQVGLTWARQAQLRIVYHPADNWAFAVSLENSDQLVSTAVTTPVLFSGVVGQVDETSGGTLATPPTPNVAPDIIAKLANDTKVGDKNLHFEIAGLVSEFKLLTPGSITGSATSSTRVKAGGGGSINTNLEIFKNFRLIENAFYSDGGGRYIFGLGPDLVVSQATTTSPFTPVPLHAASGIGGFEWQATKSSMWYAYYGGAYYGRDATIDPSSSTGALIGYGYTKSSSSDNRAIQEGTVGLIQTFWQSPNYGKLQLITQASYLTRAPWYINPLPAAGATDPKNAHLVMAYLDLRYVLP